MYATKKKSPMGEWGNLWQSFNQLGCVVIHCDLLVGGLRNTDYWWGLMYRHAVDLIFWAEINVGNYGT